MTLDLDALKELAGRATGDWSRQAEYGNATAPAAVLALIGEVERLREALEFIATYPKEGEKRRTPDGYPQEVVYDEYAYKRIVDSYRDAALRALSTPPADKEG